MERSRRNGILLKLFLILVLLGYAGYFLYTPLIKPLIHYIRVQKDDYYVAYGGYNSPENCFYIFVMVNDNKDMPVLETLRKLLTDDFVKAMSEVPTSDPKYGDLSERYGEYDIRVRLVFPNEDVSYGWKTSYELDPYDPLFGSGEAVLLIPRGTNRIDECEIVFEYKDIVHGKYKNRVFTKNAVPVPQAFE